METLVGAAIALMVSLIVAQTASNLLRAKRIQDEVSRQTGLQRSLDARLREMLSTAELKGVHVSEDGQILAIQPIARVSTEGERQWSGQASVVSYQAIEKTLAMKSVPFSEIGLTSSSSAPLDLDERSVRSLGAQRGMPLADYDQISAASFALDRDRGVLFAKFRRAVQTSRAHKDEPLLEAAYSLRSSTPLRRRGLVNR
jgi:hypothetical protein